MGHVIDFYKELFGKSADSQLRLGDDFWPLNFKVSVEDHEGLVKVFDIEEIKRVIMDMKENSAPGPNGFGLFVFRKFFDLIKGDISAMFKDFWKESWISEG